MGIALAVKAVFQDFEAVRWLTLVVLPLLGVWMWAAIFAGRRFAELSPEAERGA